MGNYINVNLDTLLSAKSALSWYMMDRSRLIAALNDEVEHIKLTWNAEDSEVFVQKWDSLSSDGAFIKAKENVDNYYELLTAAYKLYKKAQSESVEQASKV